MVSSAHQLTGFCFGAPLSIEGFLNNSSESSIYNLCVTVGNSFNALHVFHIPPNHVNRILLENFNLRYFDMHIHILWYYDIFFLCGAVSNLFDKIQND